MSYLHSIAIFATTSLALAASAQQKPPADPANAAATVPSVQYRSAFSDYRTTQDSQEMPDKAWRAANELMEKLGGHGGHITSATEPPAVPSTGQMPPPNMHKHH
jgi:hypothetical protein